VWKAWDTVHGRQPAVLLEALSEAEEKNWELLEASPAKRFRERLDVLFAHSAQEDLLAFLEDMLAEPEDDEDADTEPSLSREGREPMFVLLKSVVDCLGKP
jgi:broad specificity phosphatase PhoE